MLIYLWFVYLYRCLRLRASLCHLFSWLPCRVRAALCIGSFFRSMEMAIWPL